MTLFRPTDAGPCDHSRHAPGTDNARRAHGSPSPYGAATGGIKPEARSDGSAVSVSPHTPPSRADCGSPTRRAVLGLIGLGLTALLVRPGPLGAAENQPLILALGDSLTAGYGLPEGEGLVPQLEAALEAAGRPAQVENAGVSGDTTAGGRARLDWALGGLPRQPDLVILALGANDALRGIAPDEAKANLDAILDMLGRKGLPVLLVGMRAPTNWGPDYRTAFDAIYPALARAHDVPLDPFILEGVALEPSLVQPDGLHPNAAGVKKMAARLAPVVIGALDARKAPNVRD